MKGKSSVLCGLALAVVLSGCMANRTGTFNPREAVTTVEVDNGAWTNLNIFAVREGNQHWLGKVSGSETRTFVIPQYLVAGSVHLMAVSVGERSGHTSEPLVLIPGNQVQWKLVGSPGLAVPRMSMISYTAIPTRTGMANRPM